MGYKTIKFFNTLKFRITIAFYLFKLDGYGCNPIRASADRCRTGDVYRQ